MTDTPINTHKCPYYNDDCPKCIGTPTIRDILDKLEKHFLEEHPDPDMHKCQFTSDAEQALNAYILGEVNKLVGDDEKHVDIPEVDNTGKVIKTHLGDTYTHWQLARNQLRQELRNKANERWGK
jgi:hypothetical protein